MKTTKHIKQLLREGRKPAELVELGFPKAVVTRVRRQLREEKATQPKVQKGRAEVKSCSQPSVTSPAEMAPLQQKLASLESELRELAAKVEILEETSLDLEDIEAFLEDTPAIGLRHHFKCDCGASGFVALHIRCTKCGRETWWGWHPK
jgi:predicted RNase H-like nuclease (RuvC/YqgF family)